MESIPLKDGSTASHNHSPRMVELATKWLREYFSDGDARRPGDLEDDFTGQWSVFQGPWRNCPFYPALAILVDAGEIVFEKDDEDCVWYAIPGHLPSQANIKMSDGGTPFTPSPVSVFSTEDK